MPSLRMLPMALCFALACAGTDPSSNGEKAGDDKPEAASKEPEAPEAEVEGDESQAEGEAPPAKDPPPGVKTKGNLPVMTESELAAQDQAREDCVEECVDSRAMEARGADAIEADCRRECEEKIPISQVEVVPDAPPGLEN